VDDGDVLEVPGDDGEVDEVLRDAAMSIAWSRRSIASYCAKGLFGRSGFR
jgi:hypothetical protein